MLERLKRKLFYSRPFRRLIKWAKGVQPPGFEGFSLYEISRFFFEAIDEGDLITRASAISFRVFMAFFPAIIVLLTLIPFVPIADFQERLLVAVHDVLPLDVYLFIESTLHDLVVRKHHTLLSISFILGLFFASNSVNAILLGFSGSKNLTRWHSAFKQRMLSMWVLLALSILMMMVIPLVTLSGLVIHALDQVGFFGNFIQVAIVFFIKWSLSIFLVILCVALLFNAGEMRGRRFRIITPGTILSVFLILLASEALAYVFSNITDYNALYGSIGAILAVQLWIYINMIVLLIGFELNTSISRAHRLRTEKLEQVK
ncbi:MAG: YihY/virulence factor BrkB family protein [Bacteroidota bacterium]|nr:YihY/virulence factor BrkB family protein [Bacteroidota bacterium]